MTINDDSDLQVLERDLSALAEPRADDERMRLTIRRELTTSLSPRPRRRRISTRFALGSIAVAAAVAAIALVVFVGATGPAGESGTADAAIIHNALREVTPPANAILHVKVVGEQNGVSVAGETWQQTGPPYASRGIKGPRGHQGEFGQSGRTLFEYDPRTNTISEKLGAAGPVFRDPISLVRRELATGQAQVAGTVVIGGATLYKIGLPGGLITYVDANSYQPRYLDDPQRDGGIVRLRVVTYQYLPMTPSNRALLSVTAQHPSARIESGSSSNGSK